MKVRAVLEALHRALPKSRRGVAVLAYHLVDGGTDSPVDLPLSVFREQLEILKGEFEVLSLDAALSPARGSRPAVVLTFDDAYVNFRRVAWPVLAELALPAILYVPVGFIEGTIPSPIRGASLSACTWDDLAVLAREGVEIGSHTVSHVNLRRAESDVVERELCDSRDILQDRLGVPVTSFCYPQAKWNRDIALRARKYYRTAVIAGGRRVSPGKGNLGAIPRFPVRRDLGGFRDMLQAPIWFPEALPDFGRQWLP